LQTLTLIAIELIVKPTVILQSVDVSVIVLPYQCMFDHEFHDHDLTFRREVENRFKTCVTSIQ